MISRRAFLGLGLGGAIAATAGVSVDLFVSRTDQVVLPRFPHLHPGPIVHGSFYSAARGRRVGWTISYPPGYVEGSQLPLCLVLHGFHSNNRYAFDVVQLPLAQAQLIDGKTIRRVVLASIDGGDTYWHPRRDGDDPMAMVFDEYLPMLGRRGLKTDRIGVLG